MKDIKKLNNQEIEQVSGGFWGSNTYPKSTYHEAGFITEWTNVLPMPDKFYLILDENTLSEHYNLEGADRYVKYYLSHTPEEYLRYIQIDYPACTKLYKGHDQSWI